MLQRERSSTRNTFEHFRVRREFFDEHQQTLNGFLRFVTGQAAPDEIDFFQFPRLQQQFFGALFDVAFGVGREGRGKLARRQARGLSVVRFNFLYREKKRTVPEDEYYRELEKLLLNLARFYDSNSGTNSDQDRTKERF